jgi:hypothetical protein
MDDPRHLSADDIIVALDLLDQRDLRRVRRAAQRKRRPGRPHGPSRRYRLKLQARSHYRALLRRLPVLEAQEKVVERFKGDLGESVVRRLVTNKDWRVRAT